MTTAEYQREWRKANPEKAKEHSRRYREKNKKARAEYNKKWAEENPEKRCASSKRYAERNPEKVAERNRQYDRQGYNERRKREDPNYHRAMHLRNRYGLTIEGYNQLLASQGNACAICGTTKPKGGGGTLITITARDIFVGFFVFLVTPRWAWRKTL